MPGTSTKTEVMGLRMPKELARKIKLNADRRGVKPSQYAVAILMKQVMRAR